jgi:hypothetical protein
MLVARSKPAERCSTCPVASVTHDQSVELGSASFMRSARVSDLRATSKASTRCFTAVRR